MLRICLKKTRSRKTLFTSFILLFSFILIGCSTQNRQTEHLVYHLDTLNNVRQDQKKELSPINKQQKSTKPNSRKHTVSHQDHHSLLPDFKAHKSVKRKKEAFFTFLRPYILQENKHILDQRLFIKEQQKRVLSNQKLSIENENRLTQYLIDYRSSFSNLYQKETYMDLLKRVNIIPQELALVQAALESSWGSSYFARRANNLFGLWCFTPGCGVVPRARKAEDTHEVSSYENINLGIRSYMLFLNSHPAFELMRDERSRYRVGTRMPLGHFMAKGLKDYSARGNDYIKELQNMIKSNQHLLLPKAHSTKEVSISLPASEEMKMKN
mgnify:CR=1 FL=1